MVEFDREGTEVVKLKLYQVNEYITHYERELNSLSSRVSIALIRRPEGTPAETIRAILDGLAEIAQIGVAESLITEDLAEINRTITVTEQAQSGELVGKVIRQLNSLLTNPPTWTTETLDSEAKALISQIVQGVQFGLAAAVCLRTKLGAELTRRETLQVASGATLTELDVPPSGSDSWPPSDGWHFRPGEAAFRRQKMKVSEFPRKVLERLCRERGDGVTRERFEKFLWPTGSKEESALRNHIESARRSLRVGFSLPPKVDPIPLCSRQPSAWRLDETVLKVQDGKTDKPRGKRTKSQNQKTHKL